MSEQEDIPLKAAEDAMREMNEGHGKRQPPVPPSLPAPESRASEDVQSPALGSQSASAASIDPTPAKLGAPIEPAALPQSEVPQALQMESPFVRSASVQPASLPESQGMSPVAVAPSASPNSPMVAPAEMQVPAMQSSVEVQANQYRGSQIQPAEIVTAETQQGPQGFEFGSQKQEYSAPIASDLPPELAPRASGAGDDGSALEVLRQILEVLQQQQGGESGGPSAVEQEQRKFAGMYEDPFTPVDQMVDEYFGPAEMEAPQQQKPHKANPAQGKPAQGTPAQTPQQQQNAPDISQVIGNFQQTMTQGGQQTNALLQQIVGFLQQITTQMQTVFQRQQQMQQQIDSLQQNATSSFERYQRNGRA